MPISNVKNRQIKITIINSSFILPLTMPKSPEGLPVSDPPDMPPLWTTFDEAINSSLSGMYIFTIIFM